MHKKSSNRSFGILFFLVFLGFGLWPLTKELSPNIYLIIISVVFLVLGLLNSKLLSPLNEIWIKFGEILGKIIAPLIMALVYFLILTPISLLVRAFGKEPHMIDFYNKIRDEMNNIKIKLSTYKN